MHNKNLNLREAMRWTGDYYSSLERKFLVDMKSVPSFGDTLDVRVRRYVDGLGNWVRANQCWHFESPRYFGSSGSEVQQSRRVVLLPRSVFKHHVACVSTDALLLDKDLETAFKLYLYSYSLINFPIIFSQIDLRKITKKYVDI